MKRLLHIITLVAIMTLMHVTPAQGDWLPESAYVSGFVGHAQSYGLSCESRSAADMAAFWGLDISETEFLEALPRSDNPDKGFVGSPHDAWGRTPPNSYGVHADPVAETLQAFGLEADAQVNVSWDAVRQEISNGYPVMIWVIGGMWKGVPVEYTANDGSIVTAAAFEHTMVLTGYNADTVEVVDAADGKSYTYSLEAFLRSWGVLGNMVVFGPRETVAEETAEPAMVEKAVVWQAILPLVHRDANMTGWLTEAAGRGTLASDQTGTVGGENPARHLLTRLGEMHAVHHVQTARR